MRCQELEEEMGKINGGWSIECEEEMGRLARNRGEKRCQMSRLRFMFEHAMVAGRDVFGFG